MSSHPVAGLPPQGGPVSQAADPDLCALCPKLCRFACPVAAATADEGATPTAMAQSWREAKAGRLSWESAAENLHKCTGCEACRAPCEFGQDVPSFLLRARRDAFAQGALPPAAREAHARLLQHGNPFGETDKTALPGDLNARGRVLYWPGCRAQHTWAGRAHAEMELFRALGADHLSLPARADVPQCCGGASRAFGDGPGLEVAAAGLDQYFNRQRTWVSGSSHCLRTVIEGWPEAGHNVRAEVLHLGEYLLFFAPRLAELGRAAAALAPFPEVVLHDACGLHRRAGRGEAVHRVVEAVTGRAPSRWGPTADRTACCGAGDLLDLRLPDAAAATAQALRRPLPAGAVVVTGDSDCATHLALAAPGHSAHDLLGFLLRFLGPVATPPRAPSGTRAADAS
jgi:Fe-S oxidoreductase